MHMPPFPPFSLTRLLRTVFDPQPGERVTVLIDLDNPEDVCDMRFLDDPSNTIQRFAHDEFYLGLRDGGLEALGLTGGALYAYAVTGGSNLDLPDRAVAPDGRELSLERTSTPRRTSSCASRPTPPRRR